MTKALTQSYVEEIALNLLKNNSKYIGWELDLNRKYKNSSTNLLFRHVDGYISEKVLPVLIKGSDGFTLYDSRMQFSLHNIKTHLSLHTNFKLKEGQTYIGCREKYIYICSLHGEFTKTWNSMLSDIKSKNNKYSGGGCHGCYLLKSSGELSPHWNSDLLDEDRMENRDTPEFRMWREKVYLRDDFTCQCCFKRGEKIEAHHINSFKKHKKIRFEISNGVTLCVSCHRTGKNAFHKLYGYKKCTQEKFDIWIKTYSKIKR